MTNVTRLRDLCVDDARQKLHLEAGLGTHFGSYLAGKIAGVDWRTTFRSARRWFEANYETLPKDGISTAVFLFGFSRGALIALRQPDDFVAGEFRRLLPAVVGGYAPAVLYG